MPKQSQLINETIMYSVNRESGDIVTHHLPWSRTSPQLETYTAKGFTFERPSEPYLSQNIIAVEGTPGLREAVATALGRDKVSCDFPFCGFVAKSEFGLSVHQRKHNKVKV